MKELDDVIQELSNAIADLNRAVNSFKVGLIVLGILAAATLIVVVVRLALS